MASLLSSTGTNCVLVLTGMLGQERRSSTGATKSACVFDAKIENSRRSQEGKGRWLYMLTNLGKMAGKLETSIMIVVKKTTVVHTLTGWKTRDLALVINDVRVHDRATGEDHGRDPEDVARIEEK
ncbi:unnamed protein product [Cylicocyclus nassatus]|uniref:Uncharacterized protein n=1 Tax=Cylicocyclus nassatus TaxID=53992 RepID=A0AA36H7M9_CYLNA|nr:unnamed protein product [Cylicocyclus nassatus]